MNNTTSVVPVGDVVETSMKRGRGRPSGAKSYVPMTLATLNHILRPGATVLVDRRFAATLASALE